MKIRVKIQNKEYEVDIEDINVRPVKAMVDGEIYEVWPEQSISEIEKPITLTSTSPSVATPQAQTLVEKTSQSSDVLTAPIPGVITDISINPGDSVKVGQELIILEAMKMKNSIKSNRKGVIKEIPISKGDQVQHGQILIQFEK